VLSFCVADVAAPKDGVFVSLTFNLMPGVDILLNADGLEDSIDLGELKLSAALLLMVASLISSDFNSESFISDLGLEARNVLVFINISAPGPKLTDFNGLDGTDVSNEGKLLSLIVPKSLELVTDNFGVEGPPKLIISGWLIMFK